nr:MAG TPA: protein of unknown function (DUF4485) [Caudoviricetes sp.]
MHVQEKKTRNTYLLYLKMQLKHCHNRYHDKKYFCKCFYLRF